MTQQVAILGAGESGIGTALLAHQRGYSPFVSDLSEIRENYKKELEENSIRYEHGKHTESEVLKSEIVVVSPGIPPNVPILNRAREAGCEVIGEIEFAARHTNAHLIGITGTNGKTTTTLLTQHLLEKGGLDSVVAGNLGKSFARALYEGDHEYFVLELSSFQLDTTESCRINQAVLLNITPDHLDRYPNMEAYIDSKFRITKNQTADDQFIYCCDFENIQAEMDKRALKASLIPFGFSNITGLGGWADETSFHVKSDQIKTQLDMNYDQMTIGGKHNTYNSMAAAIIANSLMIRNEVIRESLMDFKNVEHRLEYVAKVKGVQFVNDSKATNVNSAWYALESVHAPVIWIAGGVDKGNEYELLTKLVEEKVRILVCLGKNNIRLHQAFGKHVDLIVNTTSADEAVKMAFSLANPGETVLLSPACASFDLFENYEDRGRQFKYAVRNL